MLGSRVFFIWIHLLVQLAIQFVGPANMGFTVVLVEFHTQLASLILPDNFHHSCHEGWPRSWCPRGHAGPSPFSCSFPYPWNSSSYHWTNSRRVHKHVLAFPPAQICVSSCWDWLPSVAFLHYFIHVTKSSAGPAVCTIWNSIFWFFLESNSRTWFSVAVPEAAGRGAAS